MSDEINNSRINELLSGKIIAIEAGIGGGKTTACSVLMNNLSKINLPTIVLWENVPTDWLAEYISDMDKNAKTFQTRIYQKRCSDWKDGQTFVKNNEGLALLDRSILLGDEAFMLMQRDVYNRFSNEDIEEIRKSYDTSNLGSPDLIIYLKISPETSVERVFKRNRPGEVTGYSTEYLSSVIEKHDEVVSSYDKDNLIVVDWNESLNSEQKIIDKLLPIILNFFS